MGIVRLMCVTCVGFLMDLSRSMFSWPSEAVLLGLLYEERLNVIHSTSQQQKRKKTNT
jgi:hypothetical protein